MDQYLSTYSKDYVWPDVKKKLFHTPENAGSLNGDNKCVCSAEPGGYMAPRGEYVTSSGTDDCQWSRLEPMGPLLDAKLYPTKMGPIPESETMRHDQPNTYLKKLQEKYPYLYNVLQNAPADDMIRRVDEDRLLTTYQVEYGHNDEHPSGEYDKLLAGLGLPADHSQTAPLDCRARPPDEADRTQRQRTTNGPGGFEASGNGFSGFSGSRESSAPGKPVANGNSTKKDGNSAVKAMRRNAGGNAKKDEGGFDSSGGESKRTGKNANDSEAPNKPLPAWISEYREIIGQTGMDIVRDKMHHQGSKSPGRIFMERAVMQCRAHS